MLPTEERLARIEKKIRDAFPATLMEFLWEISKAYAAMTVYVRDATSYAAVKALCDDLMAQEAEKEYALEIWIITRAWSGPFPGGPTEEDRLADARTAQELEKRREEFRRKHGMVKAAR